MEKQFIEVVITPVYSRRPGSEDRWRGKMVKEGFADLEAVKAFFTDRYGKVPKGRNKVYRDLPNGECEEVGFTHSYWEDQWGNDPALWVTDWIEVRQMVSKPLLKIA